MLFRLGEVFEVLFLIFEINFICEEKYRFHILDIVTGLFVLSVVDCINMEMIDIKYLVFGYVSLIVYAEVKFKLSIKEMVVAVIIFLLCSGICEFVISAPLHIFDNFLSEEDVYLIVNLGACLCIFILGEFHILNLLFEMLVKSKWILYGIFLCCAMGIVYLIIISKYSFYMRLTDYVIMGVWTIFICILTFLLQKSRNELTVINKELELQEEYTKLYRNFVSTVRQKQHDFDNQLTALCGINKTATTLDELVRRQSDYYGEIRKDNRYNKLLAIDSPIVVGFLYSKFTAAEAKGYEIEYAVNATEDCGGILPVYLVVKIIGNLFDNAMEALADKERKQIYVEVREFVDGLQIVMKNPSRYIKQEEILQFVKKGYSTKGPDRGLGLSSVATIVKERHGTFAIFNEERDATNWIVFKVNLKKGST